MLLRVVHLRYRQKLFQNKVLLFAISYRYIRKGKEVFLGPEGFVADLKDRTDLGYERLSEVLDISKGTLFNWINGSTEQPAKPKTVERLIERFQLNEEQARFLWRLMRGDKTLTLENIFTKWKDYIKARSPQGFVPSQEVFSEVFEDLYRYSGYTDEMIQKGVGAKDKESIFEWRRGTTFDDYQTPSKIAKVLAGKNQDLVHAFTMLLFGVADYSRPGELLSRVKDPSDALTPGDLVYIVRLQKGQRRLDFWKGAAGADTLKDTSDENGRSIIEALERGRHIRFNPGIAQAVAAYIGFPSKEQEQEFVRMLLGKGIFYDPKILRDVHLDDLDSRRQALVALRRSAGNLSAKEFAKKIGVSRSVYLHFEQSGGEDRSSVIDIEKMVAAFGIPAKDRVRFLEIYAFKEYFSEMLKDFLASGGVQLFGRQGFFFYLFKQGRRTTDQIAQQLGVPVEIFDEWLDVVPHRRPRKIIEGLDQKFLSPSALKGKLLYLLTVSFRQEKDARQVAELNGDDPQGAPLSASSALGGKQAVKVFLDKVSHDSLSRSQLKEIFRSLEEEFSYLSPAQAIYNAVTSQTKMDVYAAEDILQVADIFVAEFIKEFQAWQKSAGKNEKFIVHFATGATPWISYRKLADVLSTWEDPATQEFLSRAGIDLSDRPDISRVEAYCLDAILPQKRTDYHAFANKLNNMWNLLRIPQTQRHFLYGDLIMDGAQARQMTDEEFDGLMKEIQKDGLQLKKYKAGKLATESRQYKFFKAIDQDSRKMSDSLIEQGGGHFVVWGVGPSYEGKGHLAFMEAGTPMDQKVFMDEAGFYVQADHAKENGGFDSMTNVGYVTLGFAELLHRADAKHVLLATSNSKRNAIYKATEGSFDKDFPAFPITALQGQRGVIIAAGGADANLRLKRHFWHYELIDVWTPEMTKQMFVRLADDLGKSMADLKEEDFFAIPAHHPIIGQIRRVNLESLKEQGSFEELKDKAIKNITSRIILPSALGQKLGWQAGDKKNVVIINPHLDDDYLAGVGHLLKENSSLIGSVDVYYTAKGTTAVSDRYVRQMLEYIGSWTKDKVMSVLLKSDKQIAQELVPILEKQDLRMDPSDYNVWDQMNVEERDLRAQALFIEVVRDLMEREDDRDSLQDVVELLQSAIATKPVWGARDIDLVTTIKEAIRVFENRTALMSLGFAFENIHAPMDSTWYGQEGRGTARIQDIERIEAILREKRPDLVISNGEGFSDYGAHSTTEASVVAALEYLFQDGSLNADRVRYLTYAGVWDRTKLADEDVISVVMTPQELAHLDRGFRQHYPSQSPAPVPDPGFGKPTFFSKAVLINARISRSEVRRIFPDRLKDLSVLAQEGSGILNYRLVDLSNLSTRERLNHKVAELEKVRNDLLRSSDFAINGAAPLPGLATKDQEGFRRVLSLLSLTQEEALSGVRPEAPAYGQGRQGSPPSTALGASSGILTASPTDEDSPYYEVWQRYYGDKARKLWPQASADLDKLRQYELPLDEARQYASIPFFHTNEENFDEMLMDLWKAPLPSDQKEYVHIGTSGLQNLDIMAARRSHYGIIIDRNPETVEFFDVISRIMKEEDTQNADVFRQKLLAHLSTRYADQPQAAKHLSDIGYNWENFIFGFMHYQETFDHVRRMFREDRIIAVDQDYFHEDFFQKLRGWLNANDLFVDTIYVSNILRLFWPAEDQMRFVKNVHAVADPTTFVVNATGLHKGPGVYVYDVSQENPFGSVFGSEKLFSAEISRDASPGALPESPVDIVFNDMDMAAAPSDEVKRRIGKIVAKYSQGTARDIEQQIGWFLPYVKLSDERLEQVIREGLSSSMSFSSPGGGFLLNGPETMALGSGTRMLADNNVQDVIVTTYGGGDFLPKGSLLSGGDTEFESAVKALIRDYDSRGRKTNIILVVYDCDISRVRNYPLQLRQLIEFFERKYPEWEGRISYRTHYGNIFDRRLWQSMATLSHITFWRHTWVGDPIGDRLEDQKLDVVELEIFAEALGSSIAQGALIVNESTGKNIFKVCKVVGGDKASSAADGAWTETKSIDPVSYVNDMLLKYPTGNIADAVEREADADLCRRHPQIMFLWYLVGFSSRIDDWIKNETKGVNDVDTISISNHFSEYVDHYRYHFKAGKSQIEKLRQLFDGLALVRGAEEGDFLESPDLNVKIKISSEPRKFETVVSSPAGDEKGANLDPQDDTPNNLQGLVALKHYLLQQGNPPQVIDKVMSILKKYSRIYLDVGTLEGKLPLEIARRYPDIGVVGIDKFSKESNYREEAIRWEDNALPAQKAIKEEALDNCVILKSELEGFFSLLPDHSLDYLSLLNSAFFVERAFVSFYDNGMLKQKMKPASAIYATRRFVDRDLHPLGGFREAGDKKILGVPLEKGTTLDFTPNSLFVWRTGKIFDGEENAVMTGGKADRAVTEDPISLRGKVLKDVYAQTEDWMEKHGYRVVRDPNNQVYGLIDNFPLVDIGYSIEQLGKKTMHFLRKEEKSKDAFILHGVEISNYYLFLESTYSDKSRDNSFFYKFDDHSTALPLFTFGVDKHNRLYAVVDDSVMDAYEKQTSLKPYLEDMPILLIRKADDRVKDLEILAKFSSSPVRGGAKKVQGEQNTGGIDFNARSMNVNVKSSSETSSVDRETTNDVSPDALFTIPDNIQGFAPVIISITPITNIPELLGLGENPFREHHELSLAH